jgi:hypothetical protein
MPADTSASDWTSSDLWTRRTVDDPHLRARTNSSLPPPLLVSRQQTHQHPMVSLARIVRPALLRLHQQHPHLRPRGMGLVHLPKTAPRPRLLDARQLPRDGDRAPRVGCAPPTIESTIQISIVTVPRSWGSNRGSSPRLGRRRCTILHPRGTSKAEPPARSSTASTRRPVTRPSSTTQLIAASKEGTNTRRWRPLEAAEAAMPASSVVRSEHGRRRICNGHDHRTSAPPAIQR